MLFDIILEYKLDVEAFSSLARTTCYNIPR